MCRARDEFYKYYDLTARGRRVLRAEVERIGTFIDGARVALSNAPGE